MPPPRKRPHAAGSSPSSSSSSSSSQSESSSSSEEQEGKKNRKRGKAESGTKGKGKGPQKEKRITQKERLLEALRNGETRQHVVGDICRYILFADSRKRIVRRQELNDVPLKELKGPALNELLPDAKQLFQEVFGFELYETTKTATPGFMLRSALPAELRAIVQPSLHVSADADGRSERDINAQGSSAQMLSMNMSLLMTVLALMFLHNQEALNEETLFGDLKNLGFVQNADHVQFQRDRLAGGGSTAKQNWTTILQKTLVDQRWLKRERVQDQYIYSWGERALREIRQTDIVRFIAMIQSEQPDPQWMADAEQSDIDALKAAGLEDEIPEPRYSGKLAPASASASASATSGNGNASGSRARAAVVLDDDDSSDHESQTSNATTRRGTRVTKK